MDPVNDCGTSALYVDIFEPALSRVVSLRGKRPKEVIISLIDVHEYVTSGMYEDAKAELILATLKCYESIWNDYYPVVESIYNSRDGLEKEEIGGLYELFMKPSEHVHNNGVNLENLEFRGKQIECAEKMFSGRIDPVMALEREKLRAIRWDSTKKIIAGTVVGIIMGMSAWGLWELFV